MNPETIQRVAQNLPSHMLHSLSQVANQTPHYAQTPGYTATGTYINTVSITLFYIYIIQTYIYVII